MTEPFLTPKEKATKLVRDKVAKADAARKEEPTAASTKAEPDANIGPDGQVIDRSKLK